jgi:hypothetical protein
MTSGDIIGIAAERRHDLLDDDQRDAWQQRHNAAGALAGAADAGNYVWWFTSRAQRPVHVESAVIRDSSYKDTPIDVHNKVEKYEAVADKTADGTPTRILVEYQRLNTAITTDVQPDDVTKVINLTVLYPAEDFDAATDNPSFPQEWFRPLVLGLAIDIAPGCALRYLRTCVRTSTTPSRSRGRSTPRPRTSSSSRAGTDMAYMPFFGSLSSRSKVANAGRRLNFFPELDQSGKSIVALYGTPGLLLKLTAGGGPIRGEWAMGGYLYVVSGATLYRVDTNWSATSLGTLSTSTGRVGMADNGIQLLIVDGLKGYTYTVGTATFAEVTDPDFPKARTCCFQDGYFILEVPGTGRFVITSLYDGTAVDALDFATSEGSPDNVVSVLSDHRELWVFNEKSTEVYWNSGNADFPFERINGAYIENGSLAPFAAAKMDNSVFWIGRDDKGQAIVWRANGYVPAAHLEPQGGVRHAGLWRHLGCLRLLLPGRGPQLLRAHLPDGGSHLGLRRIDQRVARALVLLGGRS